MTTTYITRGSSLRARHRPSTSAAIVGMFPAGSELAVDHNVPDGDDIWHALPVSAGGVALSDPANISAPAMLYAAHRYQGTDYTDAPVVNPPPPPPPPPSTRYRLGVHVIGDHGAATAYISKGAPAVTMMHGALEAFQRAQMMISLGRMSDRMVYRPWFSHIPTVQNVVDHVGPNPNNPALIIVGSNEGERPGGLAERAKFDYALATELKMRQPNIEYACMSSAHGNEDYTDPAVCRIIETMYAPHYNSGLFDYVDQHNYTFQKSFATHPPADAQMVAPEWFERRGLMLITKCGFRPDKRGIINTEAGVEAGHGGFRWAGYSESQFSDWLTLYLDRMSARFPFGNVTYASPFKFGTLFCGGKDANWSGGYGIDDLWPNATRSLSPSVGYSLPPHVAKYLPRPTRLTRGVDPGASVPILATASDYALPDEFMSALAATWTP